MPPTLCARHPNRANPPPENKSLLRRCLAGIADLHYPIFFTLYVLAQLQ
jgi:hypothetical protein